MVVVGLHVVVTWALHTTLHTPLLTHQSPHPLSLSSWMHTLCNVISGGTVPARTPLYLVMVLLSCSSLTQHHLYKSIKHDHGPSIGVGVFGDKCGVLSPSTPISGGVLSQSYESHTHSPISYIRWCSQSVMGVTAQGIGNTTDT